MKLELIIKNVENVGDMTPDKMRHFTEIFEALISSGGLSGVKGGSTIIHFDGEGKFMGINLNYWPYRKRKA
jgi:hypothetical protein